jgi:hypothetical protein
MVEETKKRDSPNFKNPRHVWFFGMLVKGIEPPAYALRVRCSTPELHQLNAVFLPNKKYYTTFSQKRKPISPCFPPS